jgi:hypothetical protein
MTRATMWALGLTYALAWAIAGWLWTGPLNDLDYFSWPAARIALGGHPFLVYAVRYQTIIANDNGPLGLVPLTAVAAVASDLGWLDDVHLRRMLTLSAFSIFTLLMAWEAVLAIDRLRGTRLGGLSRVLAYGVFAASPILVIGVLGYGHIEQPMTLWLVLLAVRKLARDRALAAGICFGLAMLTRTLAVLPLIPLALLLLVRGRWRALARSAGSTAFLVALVVLPFLLADPQNTIYSLLTHRGSLPVSGGSVWQLLVGTPYEWIPRRADVLFLLALAALVSLIVIRARQDLEVSSRDLYGLLALTSLTLPLLAKSVWPYYFLDAYVFGAIWWLGQASPLAWGRVMGAALPLIAIAGALLTEYELEQIGTGIRLPEGVAMGVILAVLMTVLAGRLRRWDDPRLPTLRPSLQSSPGASKR